jgi:hypothetical protein
MDASRERSYGMAAASQRDTLMTWDPARSGAALVLQITWWEIE